MNYEKKCKWHKSCGYDFCHGEGICPEFEKGNSPKETEKESAYKPTNSDLQKLESY